MNKLTDRFNKKRFKLCHSKTDIEMIYKARVLGAGVFYNHPNSKIITYWYPLKKGQVYFIKKDLATLKLSMKGAINYIIKNGKKLNG